MLLSLFIVGVLILVVSEVAEEQKQKKQKKDIQRQNMLLRRLLQGGK